MTTPAKPLSETCRHPMDRQENRMTKNGVAHTVCLICGKLLWMEDVFAEPKKS